MRVASGPSAGEVRCQPVAARLALWGASRHCRCIVHSQKPSRDLATDAASNSSSPTAGSTATHPEICSVSYRGQQFHAPKGSKLRTAMLLNGVIPHNGNAQLINCRGLGTCGTCAVEVKGEVQPSSWAAAEQLRLNFPPHKAPNNKRLRLACQVTCQGAELSVTKHDKFWGQGDAVLGPAGADVFSLPLGELEFLLDSNRRQQQQQQQQQ